MVDNPRSTWGDCAPDMRDCSTGRGSIMSRRGCARRDACDPRKMPRSNGLELKLGGRPSDQNVLFLKPDLTSSDLGTPLALHAGGIGSCLSWSVANPASVEQLQLSKLGRGFRSCHKVTNRNIPTSKRERRSI